MESVYHIICGVSIFNLTYMVILTAAQILKICGLEQVLQSGPF